MNIDVFISYKSEEKALALQLKELITTNGFTCWMAPESIPAASDYANEIGSAIDNCQVMLLLLSERSQKSQWVPKEISYGLSQNKPVIPFHIDESALVKPFNFTLSNVQRIEAYERLEAAYQELLERINTLIAVPKLSMQKKTIKLRSTPFVKNHDLIGREQELSMLHQLLRDDRIVFVSGIGGTGKTELVNQYVSSYHEKYKTIIITKYESSLTDVIISEKYFSIEGIERNQMESDIDFALRKLAKIKDLSDTDTLIVIDNFDTSEDVLLNEVLHGSYQILFTTRMNFDYLGVPVMALGELQHDKQIELFQKNYKRPLSTQQIPLLEELLLLIQGHTMTIELVARLMATKHMKIEIMLDQLKQAGISPALTGSVHHKTNKAQTVYSHIEALFDLESLSKDELSVMQNLSLMPLAGVSFGDFMKWCHYEDGEVINTLIERSWIKYNVEQDLISLHPVIADIVRNRVTDFMKAYKSILDELGQYFGFKRSWNMNREERIEYGEIAKTLYYKVLNTPYESFQWYHLINPILRNLDFFDLCMAAIKKMKLYIKAKESLEYAWYLYTISDTCLKYQYFDEAFRYIHQSVDIMRRVYPNSFDFAYIAKHAAHTYHYAYRYQNQPAEYLELASAYLAESEKAYQISINDPEAPFGSIYYYYGLDTSKEHASQAASRYYAIAYNAYYRKNYEKALKYGEKSYHIFLEINGELDADTDAPMQVLTRVYSKLDRLEDAVDMQKRVIINRGILWSKDTYRFCDSVETLADIYFEHGKIKEGIAQLYYILECLESKQDFYTNYIQTINERIRQYEQI